jgi:hypothetical protein
MDPRTFSAIAIQPADKSADLDRIHSQPIFAYARRHGVPVTYLEPARNAIDSLPFGQTRDGVSARDGVYDLIPDGTP